MAQSYSSWREPWKKVDYLAKVGDTIEILFGKGNEQNGRGGGRRVGEGRRAYIQTHYVESIH